MFTRVGLAPATLPHELAVIGTPAADAHDLVLLPDGDTCVLSAENDGEIYVVSLRAGQVTAILHEHTMPVNSLALADDGRLLLSASDDGTVRVWETGTWRVRWVLQGHEGFVREIAGAGMVAVSGAEDHKAIVWDLEGGVRIAVLDGHNQSVDRVAVSRDGRRAATASRNNDLLLWDLTTLTLERELYRVGQAIHDMGDLPALGSTYMAFGRNETGLGHRDAPTALLFDRAGRLYTTHRDVICWSPDEGTESFRFPWHGAEIGALVEHPTRSALAAIGWHSARICDLDGVPLATRQAADADGALLVGAAFTQDGRLLALDANGTIRVWPAHTDADRDDDRHHAMVTGVAIDPTGRFAATRSQNNDMMVWSLHTGSRTAEIQGIDSGSDETVFTTDGERLMVVLDSERLVLQPSAGGASRTLPTVVDEPGTDGPGLDEAQDDGLDEDLHLTGVVPIDADSALVVQFQRAPEVWRFDDGSRRVLNGHAGSMRATGSAVTSDRRWALVPATIEDGHPDLANVAGVDVGPFGAPALQCWDLVRGELRWTRHDDVPQAHTWPSHTWASLLDDKTVLLPTGPDDSRALLVANVSDNTVLRRIPVTFACEAPTTLTDGTLLFANHSGDVTELWTLDLDAGALQQQLALPQGRVCVVPSRELVLHLSDTILRAYRLGTGTELGAVELGEPAARLAASPDGSTVVLGGLRGGVHIFRLSEPR